MDAKQQEQKKQCERKHKECENMLTTAHETMYKYAKAMNEQFTKDHNTEYYY